MAFSPTAFYSSLVQLGQLAARVPPALLPAYSQLMHTGQTIAQTFENNEFDLPADQAETWADMVRQFVSRLPASMRGNIVQTASETDAPDTIGDQIIPPIGDATRTAGDVIKAIPKAASDAAKAASDAAKRMELVLLIGAIAVAAIFIVPMLEKD